MRNLLVVLLQRVIMVLLRRRPVKKLIVRVSSMLTPRMAADEDRYAARA